MGIFLCCCHICPDLQNLALLGTRSTWLLAANSIRRVLTNSVPESTCCKFSRCKCVVLRVLLLHICWSRLRQQHQRPVSLPVRFFLKYSLNSLLGLEVYSRHISPFTLACRSSWTLSILPVSAHLHCFSTLILASLSSFSHLALQPQLCVGLLQHSLRLQLFLTKPRQSLVQCASLSYFYEHSVATIRMRTQLHLSLQEFARHWLRLLLPEIAMHAKHVASFVHERLAIHSPAIPLFLLCPCQLTA